MTNDLLFAWWFFLPAGVANMTPILIYKLPLLRRWNAPIDSGRRYRGQRLLGDSKTWRGLVIGTLAGGAVFAVQQAMVGDLGGFSDYLAGYDYQNLPLVTGALLGAGALLGDALKSFFKRQRNVPPGRSWFPFDQLDFIIGASLLAAPTIVLPWQIYLWIALIWFVATLVFSYLGYRVHLKKTPI